MLETIQFSLLFFMGVKLGLNPREEYRLRMSEDRVVTRMCYLT